MSYTIEVKYSSGSGNASGGQQWQEMPQNLLGHSQSGSGDILSYLDASARRNTCSNLLGNMDLTTSLLHNSNIVKARSMNNMESNFDSMISTTLSDKMNKSEERMSRSNMVQRVDRQDLVSLGESSVVKSSTSSSQDYKSEFSSTRNYQFDTKKEELSTGTFIGTAPGLPSSHCMFDQNQSNSLPINDCVRRSDIQSSTPFIRELKSSHQESKSSVQRIQHRTVQNNLHTSLNPVLQPFPEHEEIYNPQLSVDSGIEDSYEIPMQTPVLSVERNPLGDISRTTQKTNPVQPPQYPQKKGNSARVNRPSSIEPVLNKNITVERIRPKTAHVSQCPPLPSRPAKVETDEDSEPVYAEIDETLAEKERLKNLQKYPDYRTQESLKEERREAEVNNTESTDATALPTITKSADNMLDVYVLVVDSYEKKSEKELSLKPGMKIKQKEPANNDGYAYGWYRSSKFGKKKYGSYPVDKVIYLPRS